MSTRAAGPVTVGGYVFLGFTPSEIDAWLAENAPGTRRDPDPNTEPLAALERLREQGLTRPRYNLASPHGHTPRAPARVADQCALPCDETTPEATP